MSKLTIDQAIEEAAERLPEGYNIELYVEKDAATVYLFDRRGDHISVDASDLTLAEQIQEAMYTAFRINFEKQMERNNKIFDSWPKWKKDYKLTKYSERYK